MSMWYDFVTVDVFTSIPYQGNPLAIVHIPKNSTITQDQKNKIAKEFNLSETVFLHEDPDGTEPRQFDIFTVLGQIPWAGHPTIGTICYISSMEQGAKKATNSYTLKTLAGILEAKFDDSFASAKIPAKFHLHSKGVSSSAFLKSQPRLQDVLQGEQPSSYPIASIVNGMNFVLVELATLSQLSQVTCATESISFGLDNLDQGWSRDLLGAYFFVIMADENGVTKIRARMIESDIGEDAATGSAAADLSCYLTSKVAEANLVRVFEIEQGVEMGRHSVIRVHIELDNSASIKQVVLSGQAIQVQQGKILA